MKNPQQQQRGQAILIMAFAVIALAALVGLAIDGGRLYTLRRQAQNAADATALAATRELASLLSKCASGTAAQNAAIFNTVLEYARLNGIDEFDPNGDVTAWYVDANENNLGSIRNDVPIPTGATGVTASMVTTDTTTFMKLFGQAHIVGVGQATAMTGRVTRYQGGFLPIAVPKAAVDAVGVGLEFEIKDDDQGQFCRVNDGLCFGGSDPMSQRGWLQLGHIYNQDGGILARAFTTTMNASGCNADISKIGLVGWASGDCPYPYPLWLGNIGRKDGDFILGAAGEMAAARPEIAQYTGQIVMLPIFDYIYTGTCNSSKHEICMETQFSGEPQPIDRWVTGSSAYYYHIIGMVSVRLSQVAGKSIYGEFVESVIRPGEIIPGAGIGSQCTPQMMGVLLWE